MSRGQEDFDAALRDALEIRSAYHDFIQALECWEHPRFAEACDHLDRLSELLTDEIAAAIDAAVGACVSSHYLPAIADPSHNMQVTKTRSDGAITDD